MKCTYCDNDNDNIEIPPNQNAPMCHDCWCEMTAEGQDWWEAEYAKQGAWYEALSQWGWNNEEDLIS